MPTSKGFFDGKTLTILGKNLNGYAQADFSGSIEQLIDELRTEYNRPLPAADLLMSDPYDELMRGVRDIKDLGSGSIQGMECDHLAFRAEQVYWQIWITQGQRPYPCRFMISSKVIEREPQYSITFSNWKTGDQVADSGFTFKNPTNARKVDLAELRDSNELPDNFVIEVSE